MRQRLLPLGRLAPPLIAACAVVGCSDDTTAPTGSGDLGTKALCTAPPPADALVKAGVSGGTTILPGGRRLVPAGKQYPLGGFPVDVRVHPTLPIAYVMNTGYAHRAVQVVDITSGAVLQDIARPETFYGMALSPDAKHLYTAGGFAGTVDVWDVGADGHLAASSQIAIPAADPNSHPYPAGMAVSPDGKTLWAGEFLGMKLDEIDLDSQTITQSIPLPSRAYSVLHLPSVGQVWASAFGDHFVTVVDAATHAVVDQIDVGYNPYDSSQNAGDAGASGRSALPVGQNPNGLVASKDGSRVFVSLSDGDLVLAIDVATRKIVAQATVGDADIAGADGKPLHASSPAGLALSADGASLYAVRAADDAVSILDPASLRTKAAIPVGWYPTSVAASGTNLVVLNGKGYGTGPFLKYQGDSGKASMNGSASVVDLGSADLPALTKQVKTDVERPSTFFPGPCPKGFPIPTAAGKKSPIEHVVLIVRENKTYDSELGDLENADGDPSLVLYGEDVTPNLHALARQFAHHDNFYDDSETSTQGHLWLTSSFVNDYIERTWLEDYRNHPGWSTDPGVPRGEPSFGTFFSHLANLGVDFTDYGEVTGALPREVQPHVDLAFPGAFFNLTIKDEEKATYVAKRLVDDGVFPPFVYVLLPDDHTNGTTPGDPTPESMISDNDYATGLLVDKITHSPYWKSTAIFIVEDDPQIGGDHVDYHRSYLVVVSPYAKHGYVSHVNTSFPSMFRTFELILGVPAMNRYDALAPALFDVFTATPDMATFDAVTRKVPDAMNPQNAAGGGYSAMMDFRGPDRNPELGAILYWERTGAPPAGSRIAAEVARHAPPTLPEEVDPDDEGMEAAGWLWAESRAALPDAKVDLRSNHAAPRRAVRELDSE